MTAAGPSALRLGAAIALASLVVGLAPVAGVARSQLQAALGPRFAVVLPALLGLIVVAALVRAWPRARGVSARRLPLVALAAGIAALYTWRMGNADPAIRAVELVHLVEYGAITLAFHRVWHDRGPLASLALPGLAAFLAGVAEEAYQWWLPARVGELADVALNGVAIGCALLAITGLTPAATGRRRLDARDRRSLIRLATLTVVAVAAFVHVVHLGVRVSDGVTAFDSRYSASRLAALAAERGATWALAPPLVRPDRLSREDQYMTEGLQHVQARNAAWSRGDAVTAWHENRILERHFAPVLDTPSYVASAGHRWAIGQRDEAAARAGAGAQTPLVSRAFPYPLFRWSPWTLWSGALVVAAGLLRGDRAIAS